MYGSDSRFLHVKGASGCRGHSADGLPAAAVNISHSAAGRDNKHDCVGRADDEAGGTVEIPL